MPLLLLLQPETTERVLTFPLNLVVEDPPKAELIVYTESAVMRVDESTETSLRVDEGQLASLRVDEVEPTRMRVWDEPFVRS